jgi:hypothetical protein
MVVLLLVAAFVNQDTWNAGVDLIHSFRSHNSTVAEDAGCLRIHDSPLGAQAQVLRDHFATLHQGVDGFRSALHDTAWDSFAGKRASYLANPEHRGDQAIRNQFEAVTGLLKNMNSKRIDSLVEYRKGYCVNAFTTIYTAGKRMKRISYMFFEDNRQKASRDEICKLSREHYNLVWMLHPKHAGIHDAMYDLLISIFQLTKGVDTFLKHRIHCPRSPSTALRGPQGECLYKLPAWTEAVPWFLVALWYQKELERQEWNCDLADHNEELEQLYGKKCPDEDKMTFFELIQSHPSEDIRNATMNMAQTLRRQSGEVLEAAQKAWTILRQYFDRFKFMRLFDLQTHQRWQCNEWEELYQRELGADLEHDQRTNGFGDNAQSELWSAHLLNRSNVELERFLREPDAFAQIFEMLLNAMFRNGC